MSVARRASDEQGVAMVVVMGVLLVLALLGSVALAISLSLGTATRNDTLKKRAYEAAQAGLQATIYRLTAAAPAAGSCLGGDPNPTVQAPAQGAWCAPHTESLGNLTSYSARTSAVLASAPGATCAGIPVGSGGQVDERCVVSTGTAEGTSRRVEARVVSYASTPLFPVAGLVGYRSVTLQNNAGVSGGIGSNGQVSLANNAWANSTTLGPAAPNPSGGGTPGTITRRTAGQGPFQAAPVDPANSATVNDDGRIANGLRSPPASPFDSVSGTVSWDPTTRTLAIGRGGNSGAVTLGGSIYNFCSLTLSNNSTLTLAAGARAAIFIDDPSRAGSGCPAGTGTFSMSNNAALVNTSPPASGSSLAHDPTALQLYVVGASAITLANNSDFFGTIYAPQASLVVSPSNNTRLYGAVAAADVTLYNRATFTGDANATGIGAGASQYFQAAWRECTPAPTGADPGSGC